MHYAYNGLTFNHYRSINWKRIWENFEKLAIDETLENLGLFKEWSGKYGQLVLLRTLLAKYMIANDTEWRKFDHKFQNWYRNACLPPSGKNWEIQQKWIEDYFKALDVS